MAEFTFFQLSDASGEILDHLLSSGGKLGLSTAGFLQGGPFAFQPLLFGFELRESLLHLTDLGLHFISRSRSAFGYPNRHRGQR